MPGLRLTMRICSGFSLAAFSIAFLSATSIGWAQLSSHPTATVEVEELEQREVSGARSFVGDVVPLRRSMIGSAVAGRVEQFFVDDGDYVGMPGSQLNRRDREDSSFEDEEEWGQPIAQLQVRMASISLEAALAEQRLRMHELEELKQGSRDEERIQGAAAKDSAEAVLEYAKARYDRARRLYEQGASATQEELERALSEKAAAEQEWVRAKAAYELVMTGPRQEQIEQAQARLDMAAEQVRLQEDAKSKFTIRAPYAGYVVSKLTEVGAWLAQGDPVVEVIEIDPIEVRVAIPQDFVAQLRPNMQVRVHLESRPDELLMGRIHRIIPQADSRSRTFPVLVRLDNPLRDDGTHVLMPGMLVQVIFPTGAPKVALMASKDSLIWTGNSAHVFVVTQNSPSGVVSARRVPVQVGIVDRSRFEITDPQGTLRARQQLVVVGNERLHDGQPLNVVHVRASVAEATADKAARN
jgi:RND family efflux transporter MFP subunit